MTTTTEARTIRLTSFGQALEEISGSPSLMCHDDAIPEYVRHVTAEGYGVRERRGDSGLYIVEIGYSRNIDRDGVADWGADANRCRAYRYALAAFFGSIEDPTL